MPPVRMPTLLDATLSDGWRCTIQVTPAQSSINFLDTDGCHVSDTILSTVCSDINMHMPTSPNATPANGWLCTIQVRVIIRVIIIIMVVMSHFPAHVLGVCGPSPTLSGWPVLSITVRTMMLTVEQLQVRVHSRFSTCLTELRVPYMVCLRNCLQHLTCYMYHIKLVCCLDPCLH